MLKKLPVTNPRLHCTKSRHRLIAKYIDDKGIRYCKRCAKRYNKLRPKSKKGFRCKRKVVGKRVSELRRRATKAERIFKRKLTQAIKVKFQFQRGFIKGGYFAIVDFHIPSRRICIEIDGGYHDTPEQKRKDHHRDSWLRDVRKQRVIRLTNKQAEAMTVDEIKELVAEKSSLGLDVMQPNSV